MKVAGFDNDPLWSYPGVIGSPGDASGFPEVKERPGDAKGFWKVLPAGESGVSPRLSGVGPFGNSHCVACVGRWM